MGWHRRRARAVTGDHRVKQPQVLGYRVREPARRGRGQDEPPAPGLFRPGERQDLRVIGQTLGREIDQVGAVVLARRAAAPEGDEQPREPPRPLPHETAAALTLATYSGQSGCRRGLQREEEPPEFR